MKLRELKNTAVHCETKAEFDRLMSIYEDAGWEWCNGRKPKEIDYNGEDGYRPGVPRKYIAVHDGFLWRELGDFPDTWENIISLSDFLREQGLEQEELKAGDWVEVVEDFTQDSVQFFKGERFEVDVNDHTDHLPIRLKTTGKSFGDRFWVPSSKLRKCSPPEEKSRCTCGGSCVDPCESCNVPYPLGTTHTVSSVKYEIPADYGFGSLARMIIHHGIDKMTDESVSTSHSPSLMDRIGSAVSYLREKALSKSEKTLRKVGFKNGAGQWTGFDGCESNSAVSALLTILLDKHEKELVDLADEMIKADEDERKKCCK